MNRWKIKYYTTPSDDNPIQQLIDNLSVKAKSRVYYTLELLQEFGPLLRMPHTKKIIGTPLWEIRILGEKSLRFFYIAIIRQSFLLLHGFTKRKQKTPIKEIQTALNRLRDYKSR